MRSIWLFTALSGAFTLAACGGGDGGSSPAAPAAPVAATPTATLAAAPTTINAGAASTLTWSSTNATACTAAGRWSGPLPTSGSQTTGPLSESETYSLTCTNASKASTAATATVTVNALPTVTLTATPATVTTGAAATLTWNSTNALACTATGRWSGPLPTSGTQTTGPLSASETYSLTCTNATAASQPATAIVAVVAAATPPPVTPPPVAPPGATPVPTATLTATPTIVPAGGTTVLTWGSTNATSCTASGGWTGALAVAGTRTTAALTTGTTYSLTCVGPGGTSPVATVTVGISSATAIIAPTNAALTVSQTQQFTATVPGGGASTWAVDGIVAGNAAVGTVSPTGLYTAGTTAGVHTLVATSIANAALSVSAVVAVTDLPGVYTYHDNLARDGTNTHEYALKTSNVGTATFGKRAACATDGAVYAQPLWVANVTVNGAKHNVVYVATEHDGLFAFDSDASPCVKLWSVSLIDAAHGAVAAGESPVPTNLVGLGAGDISPEIGVTGTPVIDPATGVLYVVSKSIDVSTLNTTKVMYQRLHAIDITTGAEKSPPTVITGTYPGTGDGTATVTFNTKQELQRAGLAFVNGLVYVAFTAHEDDPPWYGWMMSYQYTPGAAGALGTLIQKHIFNVAPNEKRGGIWMSGGAPAVDSANNIYVLTGNGTFDATSDVGNKNDYGDSLLQLNTALQVNQYFTPDDQLTDGENDVDFGAGGAAILADLPAGNTIVHALICGGKDGHLYVLNRDMLGGFGDAVAVQKISTGYSIFATGGFWNNQYYLGGVKGPLTAYALNTKTAQLSVSSKSTHLFGFAGVTPAISAAANTNGVVWAMDTGAYCTNGIRKSGCGPVVIYAYDATNMQTELWDSTMVPADAAGNAVKFSVPTVANGKVFVGTRGNNVGGAETSTSIPGELEIYGLKP